MTSEKQALRDFAIEAARLLSDRRCTDIVLLDVSQRSQVTDFVLIATGTSDRQMKTVADELKKLGQECGQVAYGNDRDAASTWLVVDFVDLVAHLFEPNQRAYYDLESMWSDAFDVDWSRPEGEEPPGAQSQMQSSFGDDDE